MFKKATKGEIKTWMLGDIFITIMLFVSSFAMFQKYSEEVKDPDIKLLIFGIIFLLIGIFCVFFFYKMILAYRSYEERMAVLEKEMEEERLQREAEEQERIRREEEETQKFIEEYQKKVKEAEEQRQLEEQKKKTGTKGNK